MILHKPFLCLNRLALYGKGKVVYDQLFRKGVNIIRGSNGSGKSTVADFIFFVLGGDLNSWKLEAEWCDFVMAEVSVNDVLITIKRQITASKRQGMLIYWGSFENAKSNAVEGWQQFSFQRSAQKDSFSQVLFNALELPEVKGDFDSNITMHQLLRLIYVDQLSAVDSLMRQEDFDSPLTRQTVSDLLLGVYDDSLYSNELSLRSKQRELEDSSQQLNSLLNVLGDVQDTIDLSSVLETISETTRQQQRVTATLTAHSDATPRESIADVNLENLHISKSSRRHGINGRRLRMNMSDNFSK